MIAMPPVSGVIDRRFLINYRVDPDVLQALLPLRFRPHLVSDVGVAGICVLRLRHVRPQGLPGALGIATDNAAHRIAVEWDTPEGVRRGVYIVRRDTSSRTTVQLGGRLFPGVHARADFTFDERPEQFRLAFTSRRDDTSVAMSARLDSAVPNGSLFSSVDAASSFFQDSPVGWSPRHDSSSIESLELSCATWKVEPLQVEYLTSSFYDDHARFPEGSATFDSAFVMRGIASTWRAAGSMTSSNVVDASR
ncbi:MAG: DUF2071 domain-containing protein [Acidimicrobiales bacterium]